MTDIERFVREHSGLDEAELRLEITPLRGGLVSDSVAHVRAHLGGAARPRRLSFVAKRLPGSSREAAVYGVLHEGASGPPAPRLYGLQEDENGARMYIEAIRPARRWPWPDEHLACQVLEHLAKLHATDAASFVAAVPEWDYTKELEDRAWEALEVFDAATRGDSAALLLRPYRRVLRRVASDVRQVHHFLVEAAPFGPTVVHGDVHPGNVIARRSRQRLEPVLIDWERARVGSGLEDVASWLQSLGFWDIETRKRHDTLLSRYLVARGLPPLPDRGTRDLYWLAAACNALSGALAYHLEVAAEPSSPAGRRYLSLTAAHQALRVVRQADARWRAMQAQAPALLARAASPLSS